jgi:hypothetical protein
MEIGKPKRIYRVEPLHDPVPKHEPAPEQTPAPVPERPKPVPSR